MNRKLYDYFNYLMGLGLVLTLVVFLLNSLIPSAPPSNWQTTPASQEIRGVWLTNVASGVLFTPWGVKLAMHQLSQLNFNTVYPVVWNRGSTFYPSAIAKQVTGKAEEPLLKLAHLGQDTLAEIIEQGHQQGLRVIPWFEYGFMAPKNSQLAKLHPDWLSHNQKRSSIREVWLNPLHPEVQKFILELIVEVVRKYDVDGIQLDDHFGMPVELGYDPFTLKLYQQEHQGTSPPNDPHDSKWMRWRAQKITDFMQEIFQAVKSVKPECLVSLSPNSKHFAYRHYLQDWQTWVERGLVEELILQVYRRDLSSFQAELVKPELYFAQSRIPVGVAILTGTPRLPVAIEAIQQQVQVVRDRGLDGVSFFYWESLWGYIAPESPQERRRAFRAIFSSPEVVQGSTQEG
ncbi:MAG: family 10 glycosylhydrolase [Symploca sp. SIO2E9]|nr:family 10 glycosylhydrolase [Symploca sp. SIO2E9]